MQLIRKKNSINICSITSVKMRTPLHIAAEQNNTELFLLLAELTDEPMIMFKSGKKKLVDVIIENKAFGCFKELFENNLFNLDEISDDLIQCNEYLIKNGMIKFLELNIKNGFVRKDHEAPLNVIAAKYSSALSLLLLTKYGKLLNDNDLDDFNINYRDNNGNNLIHIVAGADFNDNISQDYYDCINLILKLSTKPTYQLLNEQNINGDTPLHISSKKKTNFMIMQMLLEKGADLTLKNNNGYNVMHLLAIYGNKTGVDILLRFSPDLLNSRTTKERFTPLILSIYKQNNNVAEYLMEKGCDLMNKDIFGNMALHYICIRGYVNLLESGKFKDVKQIENIFGMTPVDYLNQNIKTTVCNEFNNKNVKMMIGKTLDCFNYLHCVDRVKI